MNFFLCIISFLASSGCEVCDFRPTLLPINKPSQPFEVCDIQRCQPIMASTENLNELVTLLKMEHRDSALVSGWNGVYEPQVVTMYGTVTKYDPLTNPTDYVFCLSNKYERIQLAPNSCVNPCPRREVIQRDTISDEPFYIHREPPYEAHRSNPCLRRYKPRCLQSVIDLPCWKPLHRKKHRNSICNPNIILPSTSCIPKPEFPKECFRNIYPCLKYPNRKCKKKDTCCPDIPLCPEDKRWIRSPCRLDKKRNRCALLKDLNYTLNNTTLCTSCNSNRN